MDQWESEKLLGTGVMGEGGQVLSPRTPPCPHSQNVRETPTGCDSERRKNNPCKIHSDPPPLKMALILVDFTRVLS